MAGGSRRSPDPPPSTGPLQGHGVVRQPGYKSPLAPDKWMVQPSPGSYGICPPGFEHLTVIDQLRIVQKLDKKELLLSYMENNKFDAKNGAGEKLYDIVDNVGLFTRNFSGNFKAFYMKVSDCGGNEVMRLHRAQSFVSCSLTCSQRKLEVKLPPGTVIGSIQQKRGTLSARDKFNVCDPHGKRVVIIKGPYRLWTRHKELQFRILDKNSGVEIGRISYKRSGCFMRGLVQPDYFNITFPVELDVKTKAVLLGAGFLLNLLYLERYLDSCTSVATLP